MRRCQNTLIDLISKIKIFLLVAPTLPHYKKYVHFERKFLHICLTRAVKNFD